MIAHSQSQLSLRQIERRLHQRVYVQISGRFMREDRQEFACVSSDFSPGGVAVQTVGVVSMRERVIIYFNQIGRIEGRVVRVMAGGFAIHTHLPEVKREKIADQLTWLANRKDLGLVEDRRHQRIALRVTDALMTMASGRAVRVRIIDASRSGAAVATEFKPAIGAPVTLGARKAQVVRHFPSGFAVEFDRLIPQEQFDDEIEL